MEFNEYKKTIIREGKRQGRSSDEINAVVKYAKELLESNLPVLTSPNHVSLVVGYDFSYMRRMCRRPRNYYRNFEIKKKSGGMRSISAPLPDLKYIQTWILHNILEKRDVGEFAKAYVTGRGVKANARFHRKRKYVVNLDISDFFPHVTYDDVFNIFLDMGYVDDVAEFLSRLCTLNGCLPQGSPTSPYLSNLYLKHFDSDIFSYCQNNGWRYTRYADDMTFSGEGNIRDLIEEVSRCLYGYGLSLNRAKTRVFGRGTSQRVTGVVVNQKMQVPRSIRRNIRQVVYYITKYGLDDHLYHTRNNMDKYVYSLYGRIRYCLYINPNDMEMRRYESIVSELM